MRKIFLAMLLLVNLAFAREITGSLEAILGTVDVGSSDTDTPVGLQFRLKGYDGRVAGELGLRGVYSSSFSNYTLDYVQGWTFGDREKMYVSVLPLGISYDYYDVDFNDTRAWVVSYKGGARAGYKNFDAGAFYERALIGRKVNDVRFKPERATVELGANFLLPYKIDMRFGVSYQYMKDTNGDFKADEYVGNLSLKKKF